MKSKMLTNTKQSAKRHQRTLPLSGGINPLSWKAWRSRNSFLSDLPPSKVRDKTLPKRSGHNEVLTYFKQQVRDEFATKCNLTPIYLYSDRCKSIKLPLYSKLEEHLIKYLPGCAAPLIT